MEETQTRSWGQTRSIRVIADEETFSRYWPRFLQSMGTLPFAGLDCQWNKGNVKVSRPLLEIDSKEDVAARDDLFDQYLSESVASGKLKGYTNELGDQALKNLDKRTKSGGLSLLTVASFGGTVLLIRCCYFATLPEPLMVFLRSAKVVKICHGLEKSMEGLNSTFGVHLSSVVDVRNVCLLWPWFVSNYDWTSHRFGLRSVAAFLFDDASILDDDAILVDPIYTYDRLSSDQIRQNVATTQLLVDVCVVVEMRQLGIKLPGDWMFSDGASFSQTLFYAVSFLFDRSQDRDSGDVAHQYLLNAVRLLAFTQRRENDLEKTNVTECGERRLWCRAEFWKMPLPVDGGLRKAILTRDPGTGLGLPRRGFPFLWLNLAIMGKDENDNDTDCSRETMASFSCVGTVVDKCDQFKVTVSLVEIPEEEMSLGWDGTGDPLNMLTILPDSLEDDEGVDTELRDRVMFTAMTHITAIRQQHEWKNSSRRTDGDDSGVSSTNIFDDWKQQLLPLLTLPTDMDESTDVGDSSSEQESDDDEVGIVAPDSSLSLPPVTSTPADIQANATILHSPVLNLPAIDVDLLISQLPNLNSEPPPNTESTWQNGCRLPAVSAGGGRGRGLSVGTVDFNPNRSSRGRGLAPATLQTTSLTPRPLFAVPNGFLPTVPRVSPTTRLHHSSMSRPSAPPAHFPQLPRPRSIYVAADEYSGHTALSENNTVVVEEMQPWVWQEPKEATDTKKEFDPRAAAGAYAKLNSLDR